MGIPFTSLYTDADESLPEGKPLEEAVIAIARRKVEAALGSMLCPSWILGADTLIAMGDHIMGKPQNRDDARRMLRLLAGTQHQAFTGLCLYRGKEPAYFEGFASASVSFKAMTEKEIEWYLDTDEWEGAAGGYRIQGKGAFFIDRVEGQYHAIVGLPISTLYGILIAAGYRF